MILTGGGGWCLQEGMTIKDYGIHDTACSFQRDRMATEEHGSTRKDFVAMIPCVSLAMVTWLQNVLGCVMHNVMLEWRLLKRN